MSEEKAFESKVMVIGFSNDKVPVFIEKRGEDYVKYGEENNYPSFLVTLFNRSAIHNSILTSKQFYISGKGFTFDQSDGMKPKDITLLKAFIDNPNPYETLNDLLSKVSLDEEIFGGYYLHGIPNKIGKNPQMYHLDYCSIRSNADNSEFYVEDLSESADDGWVKLDGTENTKPKFKTIPAYIEGKKQKEFIYYYKSYRPNLKTYTLPSYIGGVEAIITDCEIANFHRASIQNGFQGGTFVTFCNGVPSDEEMKSTETRLRKKFTGTDKANKIVIDFVDDPTRKAIIEPMGDNQFDKRYDALDKTTEGKIFKSHKITSPVLFGVTSPGALGQRNELVDAFNIFANTYIAPKQQLHERVFNIFAPVKGKLKIQCLEPILPTFSDATLQAILTVDELREKIGMKPNESANDKAIVEQLNMLNPRVALPVINALMIDELRSILGKLPLPNGAGQKLPTTANSPSNSTPTGGGFHKHKFDDNFDDKLDFEIFSKYGEPIELFTSVKVKKTMFSKQDFEDDPLGVIDDLGSKKLPKITTIPELSIRYRYVLRSDAPPLEKGGQSREFCKAMMENPRYFSRLDIESISEELGQLYGIANYDAFKMRGGWYHDPVQDVNLPYCRHVWNQELVKKIK